MAATITSRPNVPEEIVIGTQIWMRRNYDFGGDFPNNDINNVNDYGKLYTWAEAMAINLPGWHLPTYDEFIILVNYLGGSTVAGGHLKESGTAHWNSPNTGADNSSGFTGLGAGYYFLAYTYFKGQASFWTSTEIDINQSLSIVLWDNQASIAIGNYQKILKGSVRLIKD